MLSLSQRVSAFTKCGLQAVFFLSSTHDVIQPTQVCHHSIASTVCRNSCGSTASPNKLPLSDQRGQQCWWVRYCWPPLPVTHHNKSISCAPLHILPYWFITNSYPVSPCCLHYSAMTAIVGRVGDKGCAVWGPGRLVGVLSCIPLGQLNLDSAEKRCREHNVSWRLSWLLWPFTVSGGCVSVSAGCCVKESVYCKRSVCCMSGDI